MGGSEASAIANEIELVGDGDGVLVTGDRSAVVRFLGHLGLLDQAQEVDLGRVSTIAKTGSEAFATVSGIVEQSAMYLKRLFTDECGVSATRGVVA